MNRISQAIGHLQRLRLIAVVGVAMLLRLDVSGQLILMAGDHAPIKPFEAPSTTERHFAKQNKLKATLRFGYMSDNREAESRRSRTEFNSEGFPTVAYEFSATGSVASKKEYAYDPSGTKIVAATFEHYLPSGDLASLLGYKFDLDGRLLSYREVDAQGFERQMAYTYNADNKLVRLQYLEPDGLPGGAEVYTYDTGGSSASMDKTDIAGDLVERVTWLLDAKGRIIKENRYLGGDLPVLLYSLHYQYDAKGRPLRKEKISRDLQVSGWETWSYDAVGHLTEHKVLETGEQQPTRETYKYDARGRVTQNITYNGNGTVFQNYQYSYDSLTTGAGFTRLLPDGKVDLKKITVYNKQRQVIRQEETYPDGSGDTKIEWRYAADGLLLEEKHWELGREEAVYWFVHER